MFSPTAIANLLACQHLTALDREAAAEKIKRPYFADPGLDLLIKLGEAHEQNYLTKLTEQGLAVVLIACYTALAKLSADLATEQ